MTQVEFIERLAELEQQGRENKRQHQNMMQIIEANHREAVNKENDNYNTLKRKEMAEYNTRIDQLNNKITELRKERAISRAQEEKELLGKA